MGRATGNVGLLYLRTPARYTDSTAWVFPRDGGKVEGGLHGRYPSLDKLGEGDLIHTVDFRSVYAALLDGWLGCPAEKLLGGKFAPLPLPAT
jgi:uncharacterized protein (DUF1501 family)